MFWITNFISHFYISQLSCCLVTISELRSTTALSETQPVGTTECIWQTLKNQKQLASDNVLNINSVWVTLILEKTKLQLYFRSEYSDTSIYTSNMMYWYISTDTVVQASMLSLRTSYFNSTRKFWLKIKINQRMIQFQTWGGRRSSHNIITNLIANDINLGHKINASY